MIILAASFFRPLQLALTALELTCTNSPTNSLYMILSNKIVPLVDLAYHYFSYSDTIKPSSYKVTPTSTTESSMPSYKSTDGGSSSSQSLSFEKSLVNLCGCLFNVIAVIMSSVMIGRSLEAIAVKDCVRYIIGLCLLVNLNDYMFNVHVHISVCHSVLFTCI